MIADTMGNSGSDLNRGRVSSGDRGPNGGIRHGGREGKSVLGQKESPRKSRF